MINLLFRKYFLRISCNDEALIFRQKDDVKHISLLIRFEKRKISSRKKTREGKGWISLTFQKRNLIREMSFAILTILKKIGSNGL